MHNLIATTSAHSIVHIVTATGHQLDVIVDINGTVEELRHAVCRHLLNLPGDTPVALVYRQRAITKTPLAVLSSLGITAGSSIALHILPRAGPSSYVCQSTMTESLTSIDSSHHDDLLEDDDSLVLQYDEEEARARANQNLKTRAKVRELQRSLHNRQLRTGHATQSTIPAQTSSAQTSKHLLSAPEDTSAKESSAGETEGEPESIASYYTPKSVRLAAAEYFNMDTQRRQQQRQLVQQSKKYDRHGKMALVSSSSEHEESSGAVWTEDDEDNQIDASDVEDEDNDLIESPGMESIPFDQANQPQTFTTQRPTIQVSDDASDISSGLIICSQELKRMRVRKKIDHYRATPSAHKSRATEKPTTAVTQNHLQLVRPHSINVAQSTRNKSRTRCITGTQNQETSTDKAESSTDDERKCAAKCKMVTTVLSTSLQSKVSSSTGGWLAQQASCGQRCSTCGIRLAQGAFACRCTKLLCGRHRHPDAHTCTYAVESSSGIRPQSHKLPPKVADASD